jgi:U4/U6.U5 tri-snRNP-associated protein 1
MHAYTVSQYLFVHKISYPCCLVDVQVSLELAPARVASEYYTAEEMVQFKRPKKRRKIRKKEKVKADDLLSLESQAHSSGGASKDHGSRRSAI